MRWRREGRLTVVAPIGQATAAGFHAMLTLGEEVGFQELERPRVRLSRVAILVKR
jgi:hypothetical protein